jgi:hypothetical protein
MRVILSSILLFLLAIPALAQSNEQSPKPRTKLEAFVGQDGVVIIRGFRQIGQLRGAYGGALTVEAKEFANATTGKHEYGITVEVKETGRLERENTSYIDYDELASLISGLDYIAKIDKTSTRLDNFQADYRTHGDLVVSTFNSGDRLMVAVASGRIGAASVYFQIADLARIKDLVVQAKSTLDSIRQ